MTLAAHAVTGAVVAQIFPSHPILAFCAGFASHFVLDAIPHWDYPIMSSYANPDIAMAQNGELKGASGSILPDRAFALDLVRIGLDGCLGLVLALGASFFLIGFHREVAIFALIGAIAAMLPDFLQFVYMRFPVKPIAWLQYFHAKVMHSADRRLNGQNILGPLLQILFILLVCFVFKFILPL